MTGEMNVACSGATIGVASNLLNNRRANTAGRQICALKLDELQENFDFIYDSHCLHCIVFDQDRIQTLSGVRRNLKSGRIFLIDTIVWTEGADVTRNLETLRMDEDFVLWHQTQSRDLRGIVEYEGRLWCPQRRIYPKEKIFEEVAACGFKILSQTLDRQGEGHPDMLRMVVS